MILRFHFAICDNGCGIMSTATPPSTTEAPEEHHSDSSKLRIFVGILKKSVSAAILPNMPHYPIVSQVCLDTDPHSLYLQIYRCCRSCLRSILPPLPIARAHTQPRILELSRCPQCIHSYRHVRRPRRPHVGGSAILVHKRLEICKGQALQALQLVLGRILQGTLPK